ncbi:hypothetical protein M569_04693 [Genlisea aurea]|uniref:Uncharacterized protein n=1 Tax=Genlisea aurea TaxID=192259 RepID=S8CYH2_9LAMI|nr:hypothetical protein M569_04693 [Genlisea aurea]
MGTSPGGILRLSNLFRRSLHSFCFFGSNFQDCASDVLTEETEKDLLIALSQVSF